ncbi:DUF6415 family natural product biosynthesis protein [Streptomyces sp. NPDC001407]|uniref:DUF6415 family natural product biosynthesis protein n=1 Tax=unclassified Streptomyces TaxID=2593676 RepID=UPI0036B4AE77
MPELPGTAMSGPASYVDIQLLRAQPEQYRIGVDDIMGTVRAALARLPAATTVDHLLLRLRGHVQLLLPEIESKDWARHGQDDQIRLVATAARDRLNAEPKSGPAVARCVYAQELACLCRDLLALALADEGAEQLAVITPNPLCRS